mmetsp:Transcript_19396/g.38593  ORF Transcript_19396/g.38593 Transcript_19396/m.38593 type:complete len:305 (-) Transcript_19396:363-1277(-)
MGRKSKQPGGELPLTKFERSKFYSNSSSYGTQTTRLGSDSQLLFGRCCLSLSPICLNGNEGVCTPSGHIYDRTAMIEYLASKTSEIKEQRVAYEAQCAMDNAKYSTSKAEDAAKIASNFSRKGEVMRLDKMTHSMSSSGHGSCLSHKIDTTTTEQGLNTLKRTSFWLSDFRPDHVEGRLEEPPVRPSSPMSGNALRFKDLIPIYLTRENDDSDRRKKSNGSEEHVKYQCAVTSKTITSQRVVCIRKSGQVMLRSAFVQFAAPTMTCPVTGKKFKESHIIELKKASTGFASSGEVTAKKYKPTLA